MRVAILGAGGIGGYFGGLLARAGHSVFLLARGENLSVLRQRGLELRTPEETFLVPVTASDDIRRFDAVDLAIVAVKAYSLAEIVPAARWSAEKGALILPLLNGVDIADRLIERGIPKEDVLGGLTTISAERTNPGIFERHGEIQQIVFGEFEPAEAAHAHVRARSDRVEQVAEVFRGAGVETQVSGDIRLDLWRKFAFLAPVAAVCGLTRSPIGPIRVNPLGRLLLERAIAEVLAVARARDVALVDNEISRILEFCDSLPETNKPSLLRDLEAGRLTEIDDLSGVVSRMGRSLGIETPIHDTAFAAISLASEARHSRSPQSA
ncbi:MAG: 2-dehydropantoate 2-reductase [Terriglobales bacterium]